jgi:hypothetical protein
MVGVAGFEPATPHVLNVVRYRTALISEKCTPSGGPKRCLMG